jgi:hypothetical protein
MQQAFNQFKKNIQDIKDLHVKYLHFAKSLPTDDLSDILRSEYVYAVSALDRLIHELVRIGMLEIFNKDNNRIATSQYNSFKVSVGILQNIQDSKQHIEEDALQIKQYIDALKEIEADDQEQIEQIENYIEDLRKIQHKQPYKWFEEEIIRQHGFISFQDTGKITEGLNLISDRPYKWQHIATLMNVQDSLVNGKWVIKDEKAIKTEFTNIVSRRNAIVHEADADPLTQEKKVIDTTEVKEIVDFIEKLGTAMFDLVKQV